MSVIHERRNQKKNWMVTMVCRVRKVVYVTDCTHDEALNNPFDHASDETEVEQIDWQVTKVEDNT